MATEVDVESTGVETNETLARVLHLVFTGEARTRPELMAKTGFGRTLVAQRVEQGLLLGLLSADGFAASRGGRAARELRFRDEAARVLVSVFGAGGVELGITDLRGRVLKAHTEPWDISAGPEASLQFTSQRFDAMLAELGRDTPVWGAAIGVPGPVEFETGRPVAPPIMPGWDGYDIRAWIENRFNIPAWVDNDANLMALGEYLHGSFSASNLLFVKVGTGIGAGIITRGDVQRGANGAAGDIGHIATSDNTRTCRCGQIGCLETIAAGWALAKEATTSIEQGEDSWLAARLAEKHRLLAEDIAAGVAHGDALSLRLVSRSARAVGESLASVINVLNPSVVAVGGSVGRTGDHFLAAVREIIYQRSLPLATRTLRVVPASLGREQGIIGGASLVTNSLLRPESLELWAASGSPLCLDRGLLYEASDYYSTLRPVERGNRAASPTIRMNAPAATA
jgi:glucokinase-like ROK family protein